MFLPIAHSKLDVFGISKELVLTVDNTIQNFPAAERYGMTALFKRAVISVPLHLAEECNLRSLAERIRNYEIGRGSLGETNNSFDVSTGLGNTFAEKLHPISVLIIRAYQILSKLIR